MDTADTFLGSQGLLDTRTKVGMSVAGTAVQLGHRFRHGWILHARSRVSKDYWILGQRWL